MPPAPPCPLAYEQADCIGNEVAARLAARLTSETLGEVLFSAADRGRYATGASIYQVMPVGMLVRQHPDAIVVADGMGCRHQIHDGARREAVHVARLLADQLEPGAWPAASSP